MNRVPKIWREQKKYKKYLGKTGKILSWSIIRVAPAEFENFTPYPVAIVKLDSGEKLTGQIVDWEKNDLKTGQKVEVVIRRLKEPAKEEVIEYGIKFKPVK